MPLALIADIGGTHVRFALTQGGLCRDAMKMRCADYPGPAEAAAFYLSSVAPGARPALGAFAVASPIADDCIDLTNSAWSFSVEGVRRALGLERLHVVNDFTAVALAVRRLVGEDVFPVGGGEAVEGTPIAVLGPGTGLGVSALIPAAQSGEWTALATEGGHVTMAACDDREAELLAWLRKRFGHISAERVLSGPGLVNLYDAFAALADRPAAFTTADAISTRALDGSCALCREALETFFAMLGTVAGNLALSVGARGGVYLAGGILPRMPEALRHSAFRARFEAKGRFQPYLAAIPTRLIMHPHPAFVGLTGLVTEG